jgi:hypothetical protein
MVTEIVGGWVRRFTFVAASELDEHCFCDAAAAAPVVAEDYFWQALDWARLAISNG